MAWENNVTPTGGKRGLSRRAVSVRRGVAGLLLGLITVIVFLTFYNLPFLLLARKDTQAASGSLLSGIFGGGWGKRPGSAASFDSVADDLRRQEIRNQVFQAAAQANASYAKKRSSAKNQGAGAKGNLPQRCMSTIDCKRSCRKACIARLSSCPTGQECKRGKEARLEQHAQALCSTHARECEDHCKEEAAAADAGKKGGGSSRAAKQAVETCKWRCTLSSGSPCLAPVFSSCPECSAVLCSRGRCQCSVLHRAPDGLRCVPRLPLASRLPRDLGLCLAPFSDPRFHLATRSEPTFLDLKHNRTVSALVQFAQQQGVLAGPLAPTDQLDLPSAGDFSTCAVVGSSDSLIGSGLGPAIDAHTAVFRFNDAPTRGFASDVGSRTTIRIQNSMTCGWHEFGGEMCVHYTSETGSECKNEQLPWWRDCGFVRLSGRMLEYVKRFFFDDSVAKPNQRDTSAGFFGTVLALHLCGKVDIYGFTQRSGHYFEKLDRSKGKVAFGEKHAWELERACSTAFQALPDVAKSTS